MKKRAAARAGAAGAAEDAAPGSGSYRKVMCDLDGVVVLVVDDDDDARELLRVALGNRSAIVLVAASAEDAMAVLLRETPDVLVSDIAMPEEDGHTLVRRVRAVGGALARMPAIAVTAFTTPADRAHALAAGFDRHLPKPVDLDALADEIDALVRIAAIEREA